MSVRITRDFDAILAAFDDLPAETRRADSKGREFNGAGVLWSRYLALRGGQHAATLGSPVRSTRTNLRADAHYLAGDLVDRASDYFLVPQRANSLAMGIPVHNVTPWADSWTSVQVDDSGKATPWRPGSTESYDVDHSVAEDVHPMITLRADFSDIVGDMQRRQISQSEASRAAGSQAAKMDRAMRAHYTAHDSAILGGISGFSGFHLGNLRCLRPTTTATYDGSASNADEALTEFDSLLSMIPEVSEGKAPAPNTMIATRRFYNRIKRFPNFEAGGPGLAAQMVRDLLQEYGITQLIMADQLKDFGGANADGLVLFNRDDTASLRQVVGLSPAPVKTWERDLETKTALLSSLGGLWSENTNATLITSCNVA